MNFKGTTNIPRDAVKGIIEQFGGSWNGYTWIDQTTYLETATRDALDRMLFIESERMARCLYDPEDCESERTVIISELQGGENDPDQLLDQELTATRVQGAHLPSSDDRLAVRSPVDDPRRSLRLLPHAITSRTMPRSSSSATSILTMSLRRVEHHFGAQSRLATLRSGSRPSSLNRPASDASCFAKDGHDGLSESRLSRAGSARPGVLPGARARRGLTGAKGINLWSSFRDASASAAVATLSGAGGHRPGVVRVRFADAYRTAVSLHRLGDCDVGHAARRGGGTSGP